MPEVTPTLFEKRDILDYFGTNIKNIRLKADMTQEQFAYQLGISRQNLSSYEAKRATPSLPILVHISATLDHDIKALLTTDIFRKED